jgi:vacuolar iron transporter family protein
VSVSSQRDSEKSLLARNRRELPEMPAAELDELAAIHEAKGVSP